MQSRISHRFAISLVLLAFAGLMSTAALAGTRPDNRVGPFGANPIANDYSTSDVVSRAVARQNATPAVVRPDDRAGPLGATPLTVASHTVAAVPAAVTDSSFQWKDAAVGALAGALLICALMIGATTLQRQHRRSAIAS